MKNLYELVQFFGHIVASWKSRKSLISLMLNCVYGPPYFFHASSAAADRFGSTLLPADSRLEIFTGGLGMNFRSSLENRNPYCSFHCDKERRRALVSRDVRLVVIAIAVGFGYGIDKFRPIVEWLIREA